MNKREAEKLWIELREGFVSLEQLIKKIIETKAWEPLGYSSFAAAWNDRMAGVPLATDAARALVVYALFDDLGPEGRDAALTIPGMGPTRVDTILEQRAQGVPSELVSTVRRHLRKRPVAAHAIRVEFTPNQYQQFKAIAKRHNQDVDLIARVAILARFAELEAR